MKNNAFLMGTMFLTLLFALLPLGCGRVDSPNPWTVHPGGFITDMAFDSKGVLWLADRGYSGGSARGEIKRYDGVSWDAYSVDNGFPTDGIWSIAIDKDDKVWVGTDDGVLKFNDFATRSWEWVGLRGRYVYDIAIDTVGNKWFGTDAGLTKYDGTNWTTYTATSEGLVNNSVGCVFIDHIGTIWAGTNGGGVSRFDGSATWKTFTTADGLSVNYVETIVEDLNNNIWLGYATYTDGIPNRVSVFNGSSWTSYGSTEGYGGTSWITYSSALDKKGNLWFGTDWGIYKYDGVKFTKYYDDGTNPLNYDDYFWAVAVDGNNNKWFGGWSPLYKYSGD